jgi:hypothetical protein
MISITYVLSYDNKKTKFYDRVRLIAKYYVKPRGAFPPKGGADEVCADRGRMSRSVDIDIAIVCKGAIFGELLPTDQVKVHEVFGHCDS